MRIILHTVTQLPPMQMIILTRIGTSTQHGKREAVPHRRGARFVQQRLNERHAKGTDTNASDHGGKAFLQSTNLHRGHTGTSNQVCHSQGLDMVAENIVCAIIGIGPGHALMPALAVQIVAVTATSSVIGIAPLDRKLKQLAALTLPVC